MKNTRPLAALLPLLLFAILLCRPPAAMAHKVNVFAYTEGDTVYTESYFPDGRPVEKGTIEVFDAAHRKLVEGKTDSEGRFSFPLPGRQDLTIVINASMGHRNQFILKKEEME